MFTGIVREVGTVLAVEQRGDTRFRIGCTRPASEMEIGASIACNGVCLTVVEKGDSDTGSWFVVDASAETLGKTTLGNWKAGTAVNLEPALRVGDELGGHIVSGHVDGVGRIAEMREEGASHRVVIETPAPLLRFIAPKGSIAVEGISLTVNEVTDTGFGVNIIPHTWQVTSLHDAGVGTHVNLEIDLLARYVARLAQAG